tara:strand:- start:841 stop:999 length:159 start_codon:yes stop_codon:yes gene_type:complete
LKFLDENFALRDFDSKTAPQVRALTAKSQTIRYLFVGTSVDADPVPISGDTQ